MVNVHEITIGNTLNCDKAFRKLLQDKLSTWIEATEENCDVIIGYCPIVSRVGTDVEAALAKIPDRPAVLVVLHHTFDPDFIAPDTKRFVNRHNDTITVNCLFHESQGLLKCPLLERAVKDTLDFLKRYDSEEPTGGETQKWLGSLGIKDVKPKTWLILFLFTGISVYAFKKSKWPRPPPPHWNRYLPYVGMSVIGLGISWFKSR